MSIETNKQLTRRSVEAWNMRDARWLREFVAPTFRGSHPMYPRGMNGIDGYLSWFRDMHVAFPDMYVTIDELAAEGDAVFVRCTFSGTNTGPMPAGLRPTGNPVSVMCMYVNHIRDGKLVAMWFTADGCSVNEQLGFVPRLTESVAAGVA
jgi:predicted ester cyclase